MSVGDPASGDAHDRHLGPVSPARTILPSYPTTPPSRRRKIAAVAERLGVFGRYATVSAASLITGHILLYGFHVWMSIAPIPANFLSTTSNTILVFGANRRWVWNVDGRIDVRREVVPFILFALIGLAVSTAFVGIVAATIGEGLWVNAANLTAFGVVWMARFFVLDRWIYGDRAASTDATP